MKTRNLRVTKQTDGATLVSRLADLDGVESALMLHDSRVQIRYDLKIITWLNLQSEMTTELDPPGLLTRLLQGLICSREAIQRDQRRMETGWDNYLRTAYVSRYRHGRHGRRDDRPQQWREYVASLRGPEQPNER